jgi:hypothetical protein
MTEGLYETVSRSNGCERGIVLQKKLVLLYCDDDDDDDEMRKSLTI